MKIRVRRIISLLLVVMLSISMLPTGAFAADHTSNLTQSDTDSQVIVNGGYKALFLDKDTTITVSDGSSGSRFSFAGSVYINFGTLISGGSGTPMVNGTFYNFGVCGFTWFSGVDIYNGSGYEITITDFSNGIVVNYGTCEINGSFDGTIYNYGTCTITGISDSSNAIIYNYGVFKMPDCACEKKDCVCKTSDSVCEMSDCACHMADYVTLYEMNLSSIDVSFGKFSADFASLTRDYEVTVSKKTTSIDITPMLNSVSNVGTITVGGETAESGAASTVSLAGDETVISIVITPASGIDTYTIKRYYDGTDPDVTGLIDYEIYEKSYGTALTYTLTVKKESGECSYDTDGFCENCGGYQPAVKNADGVYEITNTGQLCWFASLISGDTAQEDITEAVADAEAVLATDITIDSADDFPTGGTVDLNGYTLTYTGKSSIAVSESENLTITDSSQSGTGKLVLASNLSSSYAYFVAEGSLTLQNITVNSDGSVVLASGNGTTNGTSAVLIDNCEITTTGVYCITTNASLDDSGNPMYSGVDITITNSKITANAADGDDCAVLMNVEGNLTIENSTITGDRQAVVVRVGTAAITDSELIVTGNHTGAAWTDGTAWGSGNEVPSAALLVGNLGSTSGAYYGDADVTVTDTVITSNSTSSASVYTDSNDTYSGSVDISGGNTVVTGTVTTGQSTSGNSSISIHNGIYSMDVSAYFTDTVVASVTTSDGSEMTVYTSIDAAVVEAATNGGTITLYADATIDSDLTVSSPLTFDVNGYDLTISDSAILTVNDGVTLTTTDSSESDGTVYNNGAIIINNGTMVNNDTIYNNGTINLNAGTLDTQNGTIIDSGDVTINGTLLGKLVPTVTTEPEAETGLIYNGTSQALVSEGTANGGTVYYSLTGNDDDWSASLPTATGAGTYTVYYKVVGDSSHDDYIPDSNSVSVTIAQAAPTEPATPAPDAVTYSPGQILSDIALNSGWTWEDGTIIPQAGSSSYTVYYEVDDTNYDWSAVAGYNAANHRIERTVTLTVYASQLAAPTGLAWSGTTTTVTASWNAVDNAAGYLVQLYRDGSAEGSEVAVSGTDATFEITAAGSYSVKVTAVGEGNYSSSAQSEASDALVFYTVTWQDGGAILETDIVMSGTTSSYDGTTPTKETDGTYIYTFIGWSPEVGVITADTTYTAQYSTAAVASETEETNSTEGSEETTTEENSGEISTEDGTELTGDLTVTETATEAAITGNNSEAAAPKTSDITNLWVWTLLALAGGCVMICVCSVRRRNNL